MGVKGAVEERGHLFQRGLFSLPVKYTVEETDWATNLELGELRWWNLLGVLTLLRRVIALTA